MPSEADDGAGDVLAGVGLAEEAVGEGHDAWGW